MKIYELKNGAVVQTRKAGRYLKVDNTLLGLEMDGNFVKLKDYNEDLTHCRDNDFDIVKVNNDANNDYGNCNKALWYVRHNEWTWERKVEPKEKVGELFCKDVDCDDCPLQGVNCGYGRAGASVRERWEKTLEVFPQLEPMRAYIESELDKETEKCQRR